ncbi:MAG: hypothetical protein IJC58_00290 [Oscillospiraceae bacterium]|nr:hypothetical protein [Oscillospiraceae bacterium]
MKLTRSKAWIAAVSVLILAVVVAMGINSLHRGTDISLPPEIGENGESGAAGEGALSTIEVNPETVQKAVATMVRTDKYVRTVTVERLWSGGSSVEESTVYADGACIRIDTENARGDVRHVLSDGETSYIWYGASSAYFAADSGDISFDEEQSIPTYEAVLDLDTAAITAADYRQLDDENCIYVETAEDELGIAERYWISLDSGLLIAAEKLQAGETVYRMMSLSVSETLPATEHFTLPDGTVIHSVQ